MSHSYAKDMSKTESYKDAYKSMPDGSTRYIGKCSTHEDKTDEYQVIKVIQRTSFPGGWKKSQAQAFFDKIGEQHFKLIMSNFFEFAKSSSHEGMLSEFIEFADDIKVETIQLKGNSRTLFTHYNVGHGGGNGGFLVLLDAGYQVKKISKTNDGSLEYCDVLVWK